jgi:hypothetical protein
MQAQLQREETRNQKTQALLFLSAVGQFLGCEMALVVTWQRHLPKLC